MEKNFAALEEILSNPQAREAVFVSDPKQTLANLADRGIEMTQEELLELFSGLCDGSEALPAEGELSEDALESVAGGKLKLGFFHGYRDALQDALDGKCSKPKGGPLYKWGYNTGRNIAGC